MFVSQMELYVTFSVGVAESMARFAAKDDLVEFMTGFVESIDGFWSPLDKKVSFFETAFLP